MPFPWGAVIGAGASLGGSLLGMLGGGSSAEGGGAKKAKHHQLDYDRRRIMAIVQGANDAGIHPLAALGATSGAGGFAAPVGNTSGFNVGDAVGSAMDTFGTLYEGDQDRAERAEDRAYNESMRRRQDAIDTLRSKEMTPERRLQLENMKLQNDNLRMDIATSRSKIAAMRAAATGGPMIGPGGMVINPDATVTDADEIQKKYDDWVSGAYGAGRALSDFVDGRISVGPGIRNPLTDLSPGVWFDVPALIRRLRKKGPYPETPIYPGM